MFDISKFVILKRRAFYLQTFFNLICSMLASLFKLSYFKGFEWIRKIDFLNYSQSDRLSESVDVRQTRKTKIFPLKLINNVTFFKEKNFFKDTIMISAWFL